MTLSAEITNAPAGTPSYVWRMSFGGGYWLTVSTAATASYLTSGAETVLFQVTVSYGSGESATSDAVSVSFVAPTANAQDPPQAKSQTPPTPPAAPTGLAARPGDGRVSLSWSDPSDSTITAYQVRRSADGGTSWNPDWTDIAGSGATTTSHVVSGLTNATGYTFELRAVSGSVTGASAGASAMPAGPLVHNLNKLAVAIGGGTNTVASDAAQAFTTGSNAGGYRLTYVILGFVLDAGAAEPSGYTVKVCDDAAGAPGSACNALSAAAALAGGGNLFTAAGAGIDLGAETTYWIVFDSLSGGTGTVELRRTAADGEDAASAAGWTIADDGQSRARDAAGAWSNGGNAHKVGVFGYARTAPAAPANLQVTTVGGYLGAVLDWDDVAGADDYLVRWRPAGPDQVLNEGQRPTSSTAAITVEEDGEYVVRVQACNQAGCGAAVAERFEVLPLPPDPPANFTLTAADGEFELTASWDAVEEATSYRLAWTSLEGTGLEGGSRDLTGTSATVEVSGSGEWQFHLQACNEGGCGATLVETVDVANATAASTSITGPLAVEQAFVGASPLVAGGTAANMNTHDHAIKFTTGPDGYRLTTVRANFRDKGTSPPTYSLKVCTGTDSNPASDCSTGTLVNPTDLQAVGRHKTFTTTGNGITLAASTSYYLVLDTTTAGVGTYSMGQTRSDDIILSAPGWSLATASLRKAQAAGSTWGADPNGDVLRFALSGYTRASGAPTLESLEISGSTLIASFDRDLDASTAPALSTIGISVAAGPFQNPTAISVSGKWLILTSATAATSGQSVRATYIKPGSGNRLKDRDGNEVADINSEAVTNHTGTTVSLSSAVYDGRVVRLTYDRFLNQSSVPDRGQFTYKRDGGAAVGIGGIASIWGSETFFPVSDIARPSPEQTLTVSYALPTTKKLQDAWGNDVPALTDQAVENRRPLVSNHGSAAGTREADAKFNRDQAQAFTTGGHSGGYTLSSVELRLRAASGSTTPNYTVSIHSANADGTPGSTNHGTLTNPSKLVAGVNSFAAPAGGIELKPNTTYFVVVDLTNDGDRFAYTTTEADTQHGAAGWSIGNDRRFRLWSATTWKKNTRVINMAIRADYRAAPPDDLAAPPVEVLVDNNDQPPKSGGRGINSAAFDMAQAFTVGTHSHGFVLNSVKVWFGAIGATPPQFNLKVCTGSDSNPISSCDANHGLTLSGALVTSPSGAGYAFKASGGGIELTKGATYYVVLTTTAAGTGQTVVASTNSDAEDFQEVGWSIANGLLASTHGSTTWVAHTDSLQLQVLGRAKQSGAPTLESLEIDGTTLIATFDRALDSSTATISPFAIKVGSGAYQNPTAISASGNRVVLTSGTAATSGQTVNLRYTKPASNPLKDRDGNEVDGFADQAVTNLTAVNPSLTSAEVDGNRMTLTFDRSLKLDSGTNPLAFEYKVGSGNWTSARVDATGISGKQVTYQLRGHQIPRRDQTVLVRYTQPANNKLKDAWDNDAPAVTSVTATNISPYVSNVRQASAPVQAGNLGFGFDHAQPFTVGAGGVNLTSVELALTGAGGSTAPNYTVTIHAADTNGEPTGASLGTLTKPSTLVVGLNTFTAPSGGIDLDAGTYVLFVDSSTAADLHTFTVRFDVTASDNEDNGAATGWGIAPGRNTRNALSTTYQAGASSLMMVIRGGPKGSGTAPAAPTGLTATPGNAQAVLNWTDPSNSAIDKYQYRVSSDGGTNWSPDWTDVPSSSATTTTHTVSSLTNGTTYTIELRAVDGTTNGAAASVSATPARKLVGNIVAGTNFSHPISNDVETRFTTGAQAASLSQAVVVVHTLGTPPTVYELELWSTGSGAAKLATFNKPSALAAGSNTFTLTTAETLSASTTYALVWDQGEAASTFRLGRSGNHNEDSDGLTGWSINNGSSLRAHNSTAAFPSPGGGATRFALYGTETVAGPAAPTGLRATPGDAQVTLSWTDPSNTAITEYEVRQSTNGGSSWGAWTDIASSGATTTSHTVSSLTNGTTYAFQIRAVAGTDNGASSASVSATPAGALVKNLNKNIGGAAGTDIVANDAAQAFTTGSNGPGYTLNYVVLGAGGSGTPPGPSGYSVKICNNAAANRPGATCTDLNEPAALAGGGADVFAASVEGMTLSANTTYWVVFDSETGGSGTWELRRTTDDGEDNPPNLGFTIFNDGLYRARAGTSWSTGQTNDSNPQKIGIFGSVRTGPSALSDLTAVVSTGQAALSWTASSFPGVTKYQYRVSIDVAVSWDPDWTDIPGGANATSYTVRNLKSGAEYTIQVRAVAGTLTGASTGVSATFPHLPAPAPTGLKAAPGDAQLALTWTDPSDANISKYQVRQRAAGGDWTDWADVPSSGPATTTHTVTGLTNWTRYTIELRAVRGTAFLTANGAGAGVSATPNGPLVSTIGQTDSGNSTDLSVWDVAQAFTTGSDPHGYTLTDVTISLWVLAGKTPSLAGLIAMICPEATAGGAPDYTDSETHSCLTPALTVPDVTEGTNNLSAGAGGIRLSANTRYFLVLDGNAAVSSTTNLDVTAATGADAGAVAGWSIGTYSRRNDDSNAWAEITSTRTRMALVGKPTPAPFFGGGGGGGVPARRVGEPSEEDFAWNVTRDIEELDGENDEPTGIWSDGETLWVVENAASGGDRLFAYSLADGKRLPERELAFFNRNRFAHGIWSDGEVVWIADAQQDTLFAYDLATKERLPEQDIELAEGNRQPRGIWGEDGLLLVLNRNPSLFLYDQDTGELLAELPLARLNRDPRGIWSDGVTIWVSDHGAKRIFAYRLLEHEVEVEVEPADGAEPEPDPADPQAGDEDQPADEPETQIVIRYELVRHEAEEFGHLTLIAAGNGSPRGIWSDGQVMFVADAQDDRVYSYNLPGAIDAHLASLTLSGIELDGFSSAALSYAAEVAHDVDRTTVEATAAHEGATVVIAPADLDDDPENGHQVEIADGVQIEVTVLSEDGSRTRSYTIELERANRAPVASEAPVVELTAGGEPTILNLDDYFSDPEGNPLTFEVVDSSDDGVATVEAVGPMLRITPLSAGIVSFEVSASDGELESEPRLIVVTVDPAAPVVPPIEVRLAARRVEAGWVEFGLQERADDDGWEERLLPRFRFLAPDSAVDRWRVSSAIEVGEGDTARSLRIVARRIANGAVEFVLVIRQEDGRWSAHLLPRARVLPADSATGRWRYSTPLAIESP